MKKKSVGYYMFVLILGGLVGSVLGDALGVVLPQGVVRDFFLKSAQFSIGPAPLNLRIISVTFGFAININIVGVLGIFLIAYFLRWIE
ncbi:MAG: DUF4321 domain-containing protein [Calditrichaeota bacterium]|nr:MAG: DUF4321 domain-containing protein [Calditrichota bacterium]